MSDEIRVEGAQLSWKIEDALRTVQNAPLVADPATKKTVDPVDITFEFQWSSLNEKGWYLAAVVVSGMEVDDEGNYPGEEYVACDFYDPVRGEPGEGKAPDWLLALADKRMAKLPQPPDGAR